jgi:hypothetical protein
MAMREAVARYIAHYQQEAGLELAMPVDDLALVLRALGIGLAIESLVSPDTVRRDLYSDIRRADPHIEAAMTHRSPHRS